MTPLHFLALIDPRATWFKKWMVSSNNTSCKKEAEVLRASDDASNILYLNAWSGVISGYRKQP